MSVTLQCNNLTKNYGKFTALNELSFSLQSGRIVGLLGPNGSGKSTMMKLAAGLLVPSSGEVLINGEAPSATTKAHVSYLPERSYLPTGMRIKEALEMFADFYADFDMEKAIGMLADLNIGATQKMATLSKGTREKVQLILVMSRKADLYLLDEPIGGVDPAARDYILNTIIKNYNENATLVISTHLITDIEKVLDDVVLIKNGKVVLADSVDNIREREGKSVDTLFREVFRC
ncbi:MAG: ABC transporter ATP-binding protein [Oscillospiraceae bacterium]